MIEQSYITPIERSGWRRLVFAAAWRVLRAVNYVMRLPFGNHCRQDKSALDWVGLLESAAPEIQAEARALLARRAELDDPLPPVYGEGAAGDWRVFPLYWLGSPLAAAETQCPRTMAALRRVPRLRTATFSILGPRQHIARHEHPFITYLIFHVGLVIPAARDRCRMDLDGETVNWREGEAIVFDPTYPHEVWNESDEVRVILAGEVGRKHPFPFSLVDALVWNFTRLRPWDRKTFPDEAPSPQA